MPEISIMGSNITDLCKYIAVNSGKEGNVLDGGTVKSVRLQTIHTIVICPSAGRYST